MRNNPDDMANQLITKIKLWLEKEITNSFSHNIDDDGHLSYSENRQLGIFDGKHECARTLINQITEWQKE